MQHKIYTELTEPLYIYPAWVLRRFNKRLLAYHIGSWGLGLFLLWIEYIMLHNEENVKEDRDLKINNLANQMQYISTVLINNLTTSLHYE